MTANTTDPGNIDHVCRPFVCHIPAIARVLMGMLFVVTGLNGFLNVLPPPSRPMPEKALAFANAMVNTSYLLPLVMGTQLVAGALLLANRLVPLALAIVVLMLEGYLAWKYRMAFQTMLCMRAAPMDH